MNENDNCNEQTWKSQSVGNSLDKRASRAKRWRGDAGSAIVIDHRSYCNIENSDCDLAHSKRLAIVLGVAHLRDDVEEARGPGIREDDSTDSRHGLCKVWRIEKFKVRLPVCVS